MANSPIHRESQNREIGQYAGAGFQFAAAIVVFLFIGRWLDGKLGTEPWLLLTGVMVGAIGGFYSMYRQLVIEPREEQDRKEPKR